jgi:hypothetical protein
MGPPPAPAMCPDAWDGRGGTPAPPRDAFCLDFAIGLRALGGLGTRGRVALVAYAMLMLGGLKLGGSKLSFTSLSTRPSKL